MAVTQRGLLDTSTLIVLERLGTCNPADFEHIDELELRPVPHPAGSRRSDDVATD
ncbi:MAG: hypothetical protein LC808_34745 [Actinobacteria bacterium]|nr:hypothetical protein [Actinomycetota bacterium]